MQTPRPVTDSPAVSPHIWTQLLLDKVGKNVEERAVFSVKGAD